MEMEDCTILKKESVLLTVVIQGRGEGEMGERNVQNDENNDHWFWETSERKTSEIMQWRRNQKDKDMNEVGFNGVKKKSQDMDWTECSNELLLQFKIICYVKKRIVNCVWFKQEKHTSQVIVTFSG